MKRLIAIVATVCAVAGCSDADVASRNLSKAADQVEVTRRIVFYNGITGDYVLAAWLNNVRSSGSASAA